jgi:hypothetical protein
VVEAGAVELAVGTGVPAGAGACAALPPGGEVVLAYVVPPVGEAASARAGRATTRAASTNATIERRDIS